MEKGFNKNGFMKYLGNNLNDFENCMLKNIVSNIIDYAAEHEHISKDQFCRWVSDMLSIDFGEVAMFMEDNCLTEWGIKQKNKYIQEAKNENIYK